jgi:hypothetical protein
MLRPLFIVLLLVGSAATSYAGWACYRAGKAGVLEGWRRPWPYPDPWLFALHEWFDARYPVRPGGVKLAGEVARVQLTVRIALSASIALMVCSALPLAWPWLRRLRRTRGFKVVATGAAEDSAR